MKSSARRMRAAIAAAVLLAPAAARAQEGIGSPGAVTTVAYRNTLNLPTLGVAVAAPDQTAWSVSQSSIGQGRWADVMTGTLNGATFTFMATPAGTTLDCATLMRNASSSAGARVVSNAIYAPTGNPNAVVETANGTGLFCQNVNGQATLFSVTPGALSTNQALSIRALATAIGLASGTGLPLPPRSAEYGFNAALRLSESGLILPVLSSSNWSAGIYTSGTSRFDQITSYGEVGRVQLTISHMTGVNCGQALTMFVSDQTHLENSPAWLAADWFTQVVVNSNGSFACLALNSGVIVTTITPVFSTNDQNRVRVALLGIKLASYSSWGAP